MGEVGKRRGEVWHRTVEWGRRVESGMAWRCWVKAGSEEEAENARIGKRLALKGEE